MGLAGEDRDCPVAFGTAEFFGHGFEVDPQGRPAPSAVAKVRYRLDSMICMATAAGPGSLASLSDVTGARYRATTDLEVVLPGGAAID
jgi:hypothetical protein